jgi:transposase
MDTSELIIRRTSSHKGGVHINGIEGFWGFAKVRLAKFKGIPDATFHLHLKETDWRFNHRHSDKYKTLLTYLRKFPLN